MPQFPLRVHQSCSQQLGCLAIISHTMTPELYIPPCCITKQLPTLIQTHGDHGWFYSRGDWGFHRLWQAASSLIGHDDDMSIMTVLVLPDIDIFALRYLCEHLSRNWSTAIILITSTDRTDIVKNELQLHLQRITYLPNRQEARAGHGLWIRSRIDGHTLVISGDIDHRDNPPDPQFSQFCYSYTRTDATAIYAFQPWRSIIRVSKTAHRGTHPLFHQWI